MAMSRKHYRAAAAVIKEQVDRAGADWSPGSIPFAVTVDALRATAVGLASMFAEDNSAFQRQTFMHACGLDL